MGSELPLGLAALWHSLVICPTLPLRTTASQCSSSSLRKNLGPLMDVSYIPQWDVDSGTTSSELSVVLTELAESELSEFELVEGRRPAAARHAECVVSSPGLYAILTDAAGPGALADSLGCPAPV
jgi:hypothetical protein